MSGDEAIVRELAERGPYIAESDALGDVCALCGKVDEQGMPLSDPDNHELSCLWRRACERYPAS